MVRSLRIVGMAFMGIGVLLVLTWVVSPLRLLWTLFRSIPVPLQIGLGVAGVGLAILMVSLVVERSSTRDYDNELKKL